MIELSQIFLSFILFSLIITVPFNILNSKILISKNFFSLDIASFNLILNCNILLLISILPISLRIYNFLFILLYLLIFIYLYFLKNCKLNLLRNFFQFIFIFFIIFFIISINVAGELNLGWDAKYFYYIKALFFIENQNFADLKNFIHNAYHPHLGSFYWAFFSNLMPIKLEYFGRLFYVYLFCFSVFYVCHNNFKDKFMGNIIFILIVSITYTYGRFSGLQEILIFSFLALLSKYFSQLKNSKNIFYIFFIILGCNLVIWFKAEGIAYATILILLINFSNQISNKIKVYSSLFYFFLILFKIIIYQYFDMNLNGQPFYNLDYMSNLNIDIIFHKLKIILPFLFYYGIGNVFFISGLIILLALNIQKKIDNYIKLINYYFIFNILFIFCAYVLRDFEIDYFVRTTMERIIFTSSGFYAFLIINFFRNINKNYLK